MEQHERAISAYVESVQGDERNLAVVVVGSVARGTERPDSDVDVYLVVDDAWFDEAMAANRLARVERRDADYPGGYLDIKLASPGYLAAAIEHGDDPTRASFEGARPVFDRIGLERELAAVVQLREEAWAGRIRSHVSQARLHGGYFLRQAAERDERFLLQHAGVHLTFAAARAAFAANRVFLRGPKYVAATLAAVETPTGFLDAWWAVVDGPDARNGAELVERVDAWLGDAVAPDDTLSTFIRDNELAWLRGTVPAEYF
jgi:predicted nucleotidyltransferase